MAQAHTQALKKVTFLIPPALLQKAQKVTKLGVTPTIKKSLELLTSRSTLDTTYEELLKLKGKVKTSLDLKSLREDRS